MEDNLETVKANPQGTVKAKYSGYSELDNIFGTNATSSEIGELFPETDTSLESVVTFTESANTETNNVIINIASSLEEPLETIEDAERVVYEKAHLDKQTELEKFVSGTDDIEAITGEITSFYDFESNYEVTSSDIKATAIKSKLNTIDVNLSEVTKTVELYRHIAASLEQEMANTFEETSWSDLGIDIGEYLIPAVGFTNETVERFSFDLADNIERLASAGDKDQADKIIDQIVKDLNKSSTALLGNNNALMTSDNLYRLMREFETGARSYLYEGELPATAIGDVAETAMGIGFDTTALKGLKHLFKKTFKAIIPTSADEALDAAKSVKVLDTKSSEIRGVKKKYDFKPWESKTAGKDAPSTVEFEVAKREELAASRMTSAEVKETKKEVRALQLEAKSLESQIKDTSKMKPAAAKREKARLTKELEDNQSILKETQGRLEQDKVAQEAFKEITKLKGSTSKFRARKLSGLRKNSRKVDVETELDPKPFRNEVAAKGIKQAAKDNGLDEEDTVARLLPTTDIEDISGLPDPVPSHTEVNVLNLSNASPETVKETRALQLQKDVGGLGTVQTSNIIIRPNTNAESLGDIQMVVGSAEGKLFDTVEEALTVQKNLHGEVSEVIEKNGKYGVLVTRPHIFDAKLDVVAGKADEMGKNYLGKLGTYLIDPLRRLGSEWLQAAQVLADTNTSRIAKLTKKFNDAINAPALKTNINFQRNLSKILVKHQELQGDILKVDLVTITGETNQKYLDQLWESYSDFKEILDESFEITDARFRRDLNSSGWRTVDSATGDDQFDFIRVAEPKDIDDVGELVLDPTNGNKVPFKDLGELSENKQVYVLMNTVDDADGNSFRLVVRDKADIKPLPEGNLLNREQGYIPRYYSETGYMIKTPTTKVVGGIERTYDKVTHIVKTKEQANEIAERIIQEELEKVVRDNPTLSPEKLGKLVVRKEKQLRGEVEGEIKLVSASRENADRHVIYGDNNSVSYGFGSIHSRSKGERLYGADGDYAPILDPVEAIAKRIQSASKDLNQPIVQSLKQRFLKEFGNYLQKGEGTSWGAIETMRIDSAKIPLTIKNRMETFHDYVNTMQGVHDGQVFSTVDAWLQNFFGNTKLGRLTETPITDTTRLLRNLSTDLYITGRPLFQIPTNALQVLNVVRRYPVSATKLVLDSVFDGMVSVANLFNKNKDVTPYMSKRLGISGEDYKAAMDYLYNKSGLVDAAALTDDIMAFGNKTSTSVGALGYAGKLARKPLTAAKKVSMGAQEYALKMVNITAFLTELRHDIHLAKKAGKAWKWDAKTAERIHMRSRKLTNTQNKVNKFKHQDHQALSLTLQFMQHIQKMALDDVIDPAVGMFKKGGIAKGEGINAETRAVAAQVTLFNASMFGAAGFVGGEYLTEIYQNTGEEYPELLTSEDWHWKAARFYLQGGAMNSLVDGLPNRLNPAAFVDALRQMSNKTMGEQLFGASGSAAVGVFESLRANMDIWDSEVLDTEEKFLNSLAETSRVLASAKDMERAYVAYKTLQHPYAASLSGNMKTNVVNAVATAFSITPQDMLLYYNQNKKTKGTKNKPWWKDSTDATIDTFVRAMNRELASITESGKNSDVNEVRGIRRKYTIALKQALGNDNIASEYIEDRVAFLILEPNTEHFDKYVMPFINDFKNIEESYESLQFLANNTDDVRFKAFINTKLKDIIRSGRLEDKEED